jgi:hypothetical protein
VVRWWSGGFGDFEFGICLEFGIWNLEFEFELFHEMKNEKRTTYNVT